MTLQYALHEPSRQIIVPYDARLERLIPASKTTTSKGLKLLLLPHNDDVVRFLNNLGATLPHPMLSYYDWGSLTPYAHQRETAAMLAANKRAYNLDDMGTGKTLSTLWAMDYLMGLGKVKIAVVSAPLSTLTPTWAKEVQAYFPHRKVVVLYGSAERRRKLLQCSADIYVVNHHGLKVVLPDLLKLKPQMLVIDELAVLRTKRTDLWKAHNALAQRTPWVWGLTGEPMPNAPTDVYAQVKLLTPERSVGSFTGFRAQTMYQATSSTWLANDDAIHRVFDIMRPAVRHKRDACIDLPPMTITMRDVVLSPAQKTAYTQMSNDYATQVSAGEITAANGGVKLSKLLQISAGVVYLDDGSTRTFGDTPRDAVLKEIIDETRNKLLIFATYRSVVDKLYDYLSGKYSVAKVYSGTPKAERDRIFGDFQNQYTPRIIIAHPKTMAHGLTLTAADTIVWYNPPSSELWGQANARITRTGQKHKQRVVCLVSNPAERLAFQRIRSKQSLQGTLLQLYESDTYA